MKYNFLITSNGSFACEEVVASLKEYTNTIIGTNIYEEELVGVSHLFNENYLVPTCNSIEYIPRILEICHKHNIQYIFPLTDVEIDCFSQNREEFEKHNITLCIANKDCISICRNKYLFTKIFSDDALVRCIPTYTYSDYLNNSIPNNVKTYIAKPKNGRSSQGLQKLSSLNQIIYLENKENFIFQPFIEGDIYTVDYVRDSFENDFSVARKEILRTQNGAGLSVQIQQEPYLSTIATQIGAKLNILGAMNFEFIYSNNIFYLMDINPRFSAGIAFTKLAGFDIVKNSLFAFTQKKIETAISIKKCFAVKRYATYISKEYQ